MYGYVGLELEASKTKNNNIKDDWYPETFYGQDDFRWVMLRAKFLEIRV